MISGSETFFVTFWVFQGFFSSGALRLLFLERVFPQKNERPGDSIRDFVIPELLTFCATHCGRKI